jgi:hypothetical protein
MKSFLCQIVIIVSAIFPCFALSAESIKLPYAAGERFVATTGYNTPPTHIKKDSYAIDFTQNGCDAYGKPAVAAFSGRAWIVEENGYNGGYGTQLLVLAEGNVVARYTHLIPGSVPVEVGDMIPQGTIVGEIGDTGLVAGTACAGHPGTHIHFVMDTKDADGNFAAKNPEPISDHTGIVAGKWYVSDNVIAATKGNLATLVEILNGLLGLGATVVSPSSSIMTPLPASSNAQLSIASGSPQALPVIFAVQSSSVASPSASAVAIPSSLILSSQSLASSDSASTSKATSSILNMSSGGGSVPRGGVSASVSSAPSPPTAISTTIVAVSTTTTTILPSDDPSDDTVETCE